MERFKYSNNHIRVNIDQPFQRNENFSSKFLAYILVCFSFCLLLIFLPLSLIYCLKVIREYERAVIFRLGRCIKKVKGPSLFFVLPCLDNYEKVDTRIISCSLNPQEILTKDSVTINCDAIIFFKVFDAYLALSKIHNFHYGTKSLSASVLRNTLSSRTLQEILQEKDTLTDYIHRLLNETTREWGTFVERIEMTDLRIPTELQKTMAAEAEAIREARALEIKAYGEKKASFFLKNAGDLFAENSTSVQLRYLQTLSEIASQNTSTIIFPIPIFNKF